MCADGPKGQPSLRLDGAWCGDVPALLGHTIALTGDRRSDELTSHLHALGAEVLHGRVVCTALRPRCSACALNELCPARQAPPDAGVKARAELEARLLAQRKL